MDPVGFIGQEINIRNMFQTTIPPIGKPSCALCDST